MIGNYNNRTYAKWRKSVLNRDKYTCQKCGQVGGRLNVHHTNEKHKTVTRNEDGITICINCHRIEHSRRK